MSKDDRWEKISQYVQAERASILEIGALDSPTYTRPSYDIKYLDFASTDELASKGKKNPRYSRERLVDVDFVCPSPEYSELIHERFDLVVANHVVEHVPNSIKWLNEIYALLKPRGILFLSVPDKRYTFDIARKETDFIDLLRNYKEKTSKPNFYHILEHFYYHKNIKKQDVWNDQHKDKTKIMRFDLKTAVEKANILTKEPYADVHCLVFTSASFKETYLNLINLELVPLKLEEVTQPARMKNEFYAVFRREN